MLTVLAPAKLNLTLEVLAKRPDGFHEIRSVIQTINLGDSLRFQLSQSITIKCDEPEWLPQKSLVSKAVGLLQQAAGCPQGATVEINKRVPLASGLGGDSSDAAAVLRGLNQLWDLGLPLQELVQLASQLGSDVAFFLYGGTALVRGRGEIVTPLPLLPHRWVVLVIPPVPRIPDKTERLYAGLRSIYYTNGQVTDTLVATLTGGGEVTSSRLFNVFESVAFDMFDGLREYREQFWQAGAQEVHLAGSGPTLFTLVKDKVHAEKIYKDLQRQGLESYLVETLASVDQVE
jgi:4-diphosphocytidyl-2-C-methyl-D-erythritol kinase